MDEYPGNSRRPPIESNKPNATPAEEPQFEKVVTGKVIRRKRPLGRRLMDTFFAGDGVLGYLGKEVLLPALQNLITDFVTQGVEKAVYGDVRSTRTGGYRGTGARTHVPYNRPVTTTTSYSVPAGPPTRPSRAVSRPSDESPEVILEERIQAEAVAEKMWEAVQQYGHVTVAALNRMLGDTPQWTDNKFGWYDLSDMSIRRVREGYLLVMPPVEEIH